MADDNNAADVVVCLGSSCFARGNAQNLALVEAYLLNHGMQNSVRVRGCLCQDECKRGPNLVVRGEHLHEVESARLREVLLMLSPEAS
ncbi:MAG: (2Fe-2S) ferredoxin domain-containing protein [Terracidiphilus sp.]|jgi:NADH:ubiquinone oxidoreductase subunit E